ncbi:hypothetical protein V6Z11_1Z031200 [Gossypium hirsutum]
MEISVGVEPNAIALVHFVHFVPMSPWIEQKIQQSIHNLHNCQQKVFQISTSYHFFFKIPKGNIKSVKKQLGMIKVSIRLRLPFLSLKKEANLKNTEAITKPAKRKYYEETEKLQMTSNKKRIRSCNNKHFWLYKDDLNKANELASKGYKVALQNFCINQVRWRNLWTNGISNNDEFRKEYLRCNERSTLWRLRTLDGRALGPNEVPPVIRQAVNGRAFVGQTMSGLTSKDRTQEEVAVAKAEKVLAAKVVEKKKFMQSAPTESVSATASNGGKIKETEEEKPKRTEEEESDRKAEELSKEDEVAKSKDQRRLEEVAKAKEALERKRRKAENAQAREAKRDANEAVAKPPQNSQHCQHRKKTSTEETKNATVKKGSINTNTRP